MKIPIEGQPEAFYETRHYNNSFGYQWCLTRNRDFIRWLNTFEINMIESVIARCNDDPN
jgi:hypothetical protein